MKFTRRSRLDAFAAGQKSGFRDLAKSHRYADAISLCVVLAQYMTVIVIFMLLTSSFADNNLQTAT
jgi:hypothetical protein